MDRKLLTGFVVIYFVLAMTNFVIHGLIIGPEYKVLAEAGMMRNPGFMWIYFVTAIFTAFFFTLIFSKGYRGTGIAEGVRYGLYAGLFVMIQAAYDSYASWPIPYSIALKWFMAGTVQYIIMGVIVAAVYGKRSDAAA